MNFNSQSLLHESLFFIQDIDSPDGVRTCTSPLPDDSLIGEEGLVPAGTDAARTKPTVRKSASYTDSVNIANERLV